MNRAKTIVALLALLAVTLPLTAIAQPDSFFNVRPDPANHIFRLGDTMRICVDDARTNANDWIEWTWEATPILVNGSSGALSLGVKMTTDTEDCATVSSCTRADDGQFCPNPDAPEDASEEADVREAIADPEWDELDPCHCLNVTGRWSVRYEPDALTGENFAYFNFTVVDPTLHPSSSTETTTTTSLESGGLEQTGTALASIADKAVMLFWIALVVGFYWNSWLISGTFSLLGAFSLLATDWPFTEELAYGVALLGILLEVATNKLKPLRSAVDQFRGSSSSGGRL